MTIPLPKQPAITDAEAIKVLRAIPRVLKGLASAFKGDIDPRVKAACALAIKAIKAKPKSHRG